MVKKKSVEILLYPVVIEACEEGGYFADCPSLQGCHAEGKTYAEVIEHIEDVINAHIEIRKNHNEFIPHRIVRDRRHVNIKLPILIRA
ncbi:MAG: type II toxin-antitoxin system HicB family antitoxin [Candidatus Harrisonbacteria bacterium]|nr:type II toxin-antitoxin system HicB family antitoxin [Candidatus Harrisonbacteria bacterium]